MLVHLCLLPVVAGVSYEVLKGLAHSESKIAKIRAGRACSCSV